MTVFPIQVEKVVGNFGKGYGMINVSPVLLHLLALHPARYIRIRSSEELFFAACAINCTVDVHAGRQRSV